MKKLIAAVCFMFALSPLAYAQDKGAAGAKSAAPAAAPAAASAPEKAKKEPTAKQKAQQSKMKACNKDAGDKKLKGDERKKFMSGCLKG